LLDTLLASTFFEHICTLSTTNVAGLLVSAEAAIDLIHVAADPSYVFFAILVVELDLALVLL